MGQFDQYQSTHLFVLVGTNPLPNYVAIALSPPPDGHVYLIRRAETATIEDRLQLHSYTANQPPTNPMAASVDSLPRDLMKTPPRAFRAW